MASDHVSHPLIPEIGVWNFLSRFIQIDEDADEIGLEYPCDIGVVGDLKLTLQALIEDVAPGENGWNEVLAQLRTGFDAQPPLPVIHELQDVLPRDTIYAIDVHALGYASFAEFPIYDPRTFLYPNIGVALGHAYPAAIGAKVAYPDRPVICFSGDGGFLMGAVEMATAMKYGINVVAIVVNDGALSAIKGSQQKGCEGRTIDTDLLNPNLSNSQSPSVRMLSGLRIWKLSRTLCATRSR